METGRGEPRASRGARATRTRPSRAGAVARAVARDMHRSRRDVAVSSRDMQRPRYFISIAAELARVHPRTLRIYEEEGLICPQRRNNLRLYSEADIERVRVIRFLTRGQGVNLAGVKVILQLEALGKIRVYDLFGGGDVGEEDSDHDYENGADETRPRGLERRRQ